MHGNRHPDFFNAGIFSAGGPNEVWSFGERGYEIMSGLLSFRERLRPYVHAVLDRTASDGVPPVRPLYFDFGDDPVAAVVTGQFMLGDDLLVAPVLYCGAEEREVYLPSGHQWRDVWSQQLHDGGEWRRVWSARRRTPLRAQRWIPGHRSELVHLNAAVDGRGQ